MGPSLPQTGDYCFSSGFIVIQNEYINVLYLSRPRLADSYQMLCKGSSFGLMMIHAMCDSHGEEEHHVSDISETLFLNIGIFIFKWNKVISTLVSQVGFIANQNINPLMMILIKW